MSGILASAHAEDPPDPIDPSPGEAQILDVVNSIPINEIENALDHFPVPYVVIASAGGAPPTIANNRAGAPTRVDADGSRVTGMGGKDVQVEVNTEMSPTRHLRLNINRLGGVPATDLTVVVAFPFDAFNSEDALPGGANPNLFFGYATTGAFDPITQTYPAGGVAPLGTQVLFKPGTLTGTSHLFTVETTATGATNPVRYLAGHFEAPPSAEHALDAWGMAALTDPVPASWSIRVGTSEDVVSLDPAALTDTALELEWAASAPSTVEFDFLEDEAFPFTTPEYNSTLTFDQMPTSETLSLSLAEGGDGLTLSHRANAPIDAITFLKERSDGLQIRGTAAQVPTEVDLTGHLDGRIELDVNANTMDLSFEAMQLGGFNGTSGFLGYDVGLLGGRMTDVPDLEAEFVPDGDRYRATATNAGESIGEIGVLIDDGPRNVIDGLLDLNTNGAVNGSDDGAFSGIDVIDGALDLNDDGAISDADTGPIAGSVPPASAVSGLVDLSANGAAGPEDDGLLAILQLGSSWYADPPVIQHALSLVDDGTQGTAAGKLVNVTTAALDSDPPPVIDGMLDMNGDGSADGSDDGVIRVDLDVIDGMLDLNDDGAITAGDDTTGSDTVYGRTVQNGKLDFNSDTFVNASDDGGFTAQAYRFGTTAAAPLEMFVSTEPTSTLIPDRNIDAVCVVNAIPAGVVDVQLALPPVSVAFGYDTDPPTGINSISCTGHVDEIAFDIEGEDLPPVFSYDFDPDRHLKVVAENGTGPNTDTVGALAVRLCDDPDEDGDCVAGQNGSGIPGTGVLLGEPVRDARGRLDETPSFIGRWTDASTTAIDGRLDLDGNATANDDGHFGTRTIVGGAIDLNKDGAANGSDDGRLLGKRVIDGLIDVDDDGDADGNDDGAVSGTAFDYDTGNPTDSSQYLDGIQVAIKTKVGLAELPEADPTQDHVARMTDLGAGTPPDRELAAGVFGIDEFEFQMDDAKRLFLHYGANEDHRLVATFDSAFGGRFLPAFDTNLTFTIDDIPQTWDLTTDLATFLQYTGSSAIDAITLTGSIDPTNDSNAGNDTDVDVELSGLPSRVTFGMQTDPIAVIDGKLDTNANGSITTADDDVIAGVRIVDGLTDFNFDGTGDNGSLFGVAVDAGRLNINYDGAFDGNDDSELAGARLDMNQPIDLVSVELRSSDSILGTPYELAQLELNDIPARWDINWGDERFYLDASQPMGVVTALVSTSSSAATNDAKLDPFRQAGPALGGEVLGAPGASGGCRIDYSAYEQAVDARYYNASPETDPSAVFPKLRELYCDSEVLDTDEDHAIVRMEDADGDGDEDDLGFGSLRFTGFQHVSWIPDDHGGHFRFAAPVTGEHPLFGGFEDDDEFTTVQIGNIPDNIEVDIDEREHITYDATDDVNASIEEIDFYQGPLPSAGHGAPATRAVLTFDPTDPDADPTEQFVHIGWNLDFPSGGAFLDSSERMTALALVQDADFRITGGLQLEDLLAAYAIELLSFDVTDTLCLLPNPFDGCLVPEIPVAWEVAQAKAGITNNVPGADGSFDAGDLATLNPSDIAGDGTKTSVDGFFALYLLKAGVGGLSPPGPAPGGQEYVPLITAAEAGFTEFSLSLLAELDPLNPGCEIYAGPIPLIDLSMGTVLTGTLIADFWIPENIDATDDDVIPFLPEIGFRNPPDFIDNTPVHVVPGVEDPLDFRLEKFNPAAGDLVYTFNGWHHFSEHVDPF